MIVQWVGPSLWLTPFQSPASIWTPDPHQEDDPRSAELGVRLEHCPNRINPKKPKQVKTKLVSVNKNCNFFESYQWSPNLVICLCSGTIRQNSGNSSPLASSTFKEFQSNACTLGSSQLPDKSVNSLAEKMAVSNMNSELLLKSIENLVKQFSWVLE